MEKHFWLVLLIIQTFYMNNTWQYCEIESKPKECVYNIECTDSISISLSEYNGQNPTCNNRHDYDYSDSMYRYVAITVVYRRTIYEEYETLKWTHQNDYKDVIVSLDLSNNKYVFVPTLPSMDNLKFLNISHNNLSVAILSNGVNFPKLSEIDFSYNMIVDIEVMDHLYIYDKLKKLDLSHNTISNIPDSVFDSFGQLESLNLSYNHLETLSILSFEGLKNLRSLHLEFNDVINIDSSLVRFRNLQELSLKHNKIVKILGQDFQNLYNLQKIDLSLNKILIIEKPVFQNMQLLRELELSDNELEFVYKEYFNCTNNLSKVNLNGNKLKDLPAELFKGKKLSSFSIKDNILQGGLITGMFLGLSNISILNISNQYLTSVEDNAFIGLENLEILLLNNNKIKSISKNAFTSLPNVKHIDFSDNNVVIIDFEKKYLLNLRLLSLKNNFIMHIRQGDFISLNNLESINLSNNNITEIDNNSFKPMRLVKDFEISNNSLTATIDSDTFAGITLIPSINLSFSEISLVKNNTFQFMTLLTYLNMSHSLINELQFNSFAHATLIETIDISFNRLTSFIVNTTDFTNLCTLILSKNLLSEISTMSLKNIQNLLKVSFSFNNLKKISTDAFADQKSLSELDLSFNSRLNLNFTKFINLGNLRTLKLSGVIINISFQLIINNHVTKLELSNAQIKNVTNLWLHSFLHVEILMLNNNEISCIDKDAFARNFYLQHLDLSFNKIKYVQPGAFKNNYNLQILNISHNYLKSINYGTFRGLIRLNILDLSYNYIESLEGPNWQEAENLKTLIIDNNRINDFNYLELSDTQLSKLSIGDNPMTCRRIHEMKQNLNFEITSLRVDEHRDNVDGIVCNTNRSLLKDERATGKNEESEKIIKIFKSIFLNSSIPNTLDIRSEDGRDELLTNVTDMIRKSNSDVLKQLLLLNDAAYSISNNNNRTNSLLERLLKVVVIMNSAIRSPSPPLNINVTQDNITLYMNKIKQELEEDMLVQKEGILANLEDKISMAINRKNLVRNEMALNNAKNSNSNTGFIEICVILILTISVCFIVFKLWKWFKHSPRIRHNTSLSRQQITESLENSQL